VWIGWRWTQFVVEGLVASSVTRLAETGGDVSWLGRLGIWDAMIRHLAGAPRIMLIGLGSSDAAVENLLKNVLGIDTLHSHNIVLQVLAASGVVGLVVWTWMSHGVFRGWRHEPLDDVQGLRVFAITLLVAHLVDYSLWQEKFLLLFALLLGFFLAWPRHRPAAEPGTATP
jgi:O-antigen ligase